MSDIFLSYAREDQQQTKRLAGLLEQQGWSVFWDSHILVGKAWHETLDEELNQAGCVIVAWSNASIRSQFVRDEAQEGMERGVLIPLTIEAVRPPLGFRGIQTAQFPDWNGETDTPIFQALIRAIADVIGAPTQTDLVSKPESVYPSKERKPMNIFRDKLNDGTLGPEMVIIPAGSFRMGDLSGKERENERPVHTVHFAKAFAIGRYTVTFDEYDFYAKSVGVSLPYDHGWGWVRRPVINVSWEEAAAYASWLAEQTGKAYRLPSEAEWEYAARAGTETDYWWGGKIGSNRANCADSGSQWSGKQTALVGSFTPNPWGLHDTVGNVWEWVQDPWHGNYQGAPTDGSVWQQGGDWRWRVARGGSWGSLRCNARAAFRGPDHPDDPDNDIGFRLVCVAPILNR